MADHGSTPVRTRGGPDVLTLLAGLVALAMSVAAFVGQLPWLPDFDPRWLLAGAAALVGVLLLMGSLRRGRRRQ